MIATQLLWGGLVAVLLANPSARAGFVSETPGEFMATGDFDANGLDDLVIVDKATGNYRVGYRMQPDNVNWVAARPSGIENVTGFSVGRVLNSDCDALVFTAPEANRLHAIDASVQDSPGQPKVIHPAGIGPGMVVAVDIGGPGNTPLLDLFVASRLNPGPAINKSSLLRSDGVAFPALPPNAALAGPPRRANRISFKSGAAEFAAALVTSGADEIFQTYSFGTGALVPGPNVPSLPAGGSFVSGNFSGGALRQFVLFKPGDDHFALYAVQEPSPGSFQFGPAQEVSFPGAVLSSMCTVAGAPKDTLLILFGDGAAAAVHEFDGVDSWDSIWTVLPPAGEIFSGALPLGGKGLALLRAPAGTHRSAAYQIHPFSGTYTAGSKGLLPSLNSLSGRANAFAFSAEPFVSPAPVLLGSWSVGDWTSLFLIQPPQVTRERFAGSGAGLDNPSVVSLPPLPAQTGFGVANQAPAGRPISVFSFAPPGGETLADPVISPAPGAYRGSVAVRLGFPDPGMKHPIFYRLGPSAAWQPYKGSAIRLYQPTVLSYYAQIGNGPAKTSIRSATYTFTQAPAHMDSDLDGVPDFVEIAAGLDPNDSGADGDGDGFPDLCELLAGTNPANPNEHPGGCATDATPATILQGIRYGFGPDADYASSPGTPVRAFDLNGALLDSAKTAAWQVPGVTDPAAKLISATGAPFELLCVATESHFDLNAALPDARVGRELLGLVPVPRIPGGIQVPFAYGSGTPAAELAKWVAAAQQAYGGASTIVSGDLTVEGTLAALLAERKVQELLLARGYPDFSNTTLFPFRSGDVARRNPSPGHLLALEGRTASQPGYRVREVHEFLRSQLFAPSPNPNETLRKVAREIYRLSSLTSNNPSDPASVLPPPVEALRAFLHSGELPPAYAAHSSIPPSQLESAFLAANALIMAVPGRPVLDAILVVRPDTFGSACTLLDSLGGNQAYSLWHSEGVPYPLLDTFTVPAGTKVHVEAYADMVSPGCEGTPIEVIALSMDFASVVLPSSADIDGDLLPDALELGLFGSLGQSSMEDFDQDGVSNIGEVLAGTDPKSKLSKPIAPQPVAPPKIELEPAPAGQFKLGWMWPAGYAEKVKFILLEAPAMDSDFQPVSISPSQTAAGRFELTLPTSGGDAKFYRIGLALK